MKHPPRPKEVFSETYVKPGLKIAAIYLPSLPHVIHPGFAVDEAYILKAGRLDDGREFQDLRVLLKVKA